MTKQILFSLLNCSWQWMLLSGLIWFVATRLRRSNTTVHLLWLLSLLSLPILFGLNQFVPAPSIGNTVPELAQAKPINVSGLAALTIDLPEISSTESDTQSKNQLFAGGKSFVDWAKTDLLLCVWAIGALTMLIRFLFGLYRIHQLRRSAVAADDSYQAICRRLARQLDINRPIIVCFSDRVSSPISFGWLSPYILIPRKLNLEQFELVAAHELAHVQRLDWLTNLFSHVVGIIFFFHPIYHFLNRELVRVRERICDDWVIRLTGARKNYAQCLLDLVRHEDRIVPLALSLNQPSQLESRIDSILKSNRRLDVQLKPRLQLMVATLLLTCLPLLAMAQLVPLKTFQVSLFAQIPQKSEKGVDKIEKTQVMEKAKDGKMDGKQYKDESRIKVKDPALLEPSEENRIFSGPQPGEKLPALMVSGIDGELEGQTYDITAEMDGKPFVLFLQDTNGVGVKGLVNVFELLLQIDAFQKRDSKATGGEKSNEGIQIGVVFLADNLDTLPEWARDMLRKEIPNEVLTGLSPDGREGPGSYGLNRNVGQTVLIAKDGKVLHNFAFTQPMLYPDPHFLGAIAQAIEVEPATLEKWLNEEAVKRYEKDELDEKTIAAKFTEIQKAIRGGKISRTEAAEGLEKLGITWEEGEELLKKAEGETRMMDRERRSENRRQVEVADPADFGTSKEKPLFSGPQAGEKLPPLMATGVRGRAKGKTFDFIAKADAGKPFVLFLQDGSGVGLRGLYDVSSMVEKIFKKSKQELQMSAVFLGDDPAALKQITQHVPKNVLVGISPEGREGPGNYGLNRNVAQTVIIAKDGKVLHNFAFTQPMLYADPHVIGAIAQAIGEEPASVAKWLNEEGEWLVGDENTNPTSATVEKWLNKEPTEGTRMERGGEQMEREGARDRERTPSREALVKRFDKDGDGKLNREEGMAARRALADRESQNRDRRENVEVKNPTEFKKTQEKGIFSGPQPGEKLPSLQATGVYGEIEGETFDFIAKADGRAQVLLLQDESRVGLRGLVSVAGVVDKISNRSDKDLLMSVVFLSDDSDALKKTVIGIARRVPENILVGISPEGREGPGNYGLNRNVAQTVIIAKDRKVLHNFAFTQPMLYADPHVLGAIAQAIGEEPTSVAKWLNEEKAAESERMQRDRRKMEPEGARNSEQNPSLEELVKPFDKDGDGKLNREEGMAMRRTLVNRESPNRYRSENVEVKNPAEFEKVQGATLFSGPQIGEKLPPLMVKGINGAVKDKTYDIIAKADGQLLVLFLQDESGLGLRGLLGISRLLVQIAEKSEQAMHINAVFLGDTPDTVENQASKLVPHIPGGVSLSISQGGREGPGSYGLNRNVAQTVIIAKDGKVLHNFAFAQPMLRPDPYLLGAVGEAIGIKPATLEKWLNEKGLVIKINNPTASDKMGKMLLNGAVVQFDEMSSLLRNLPEEQKSMLTIQPGRDVPHEQIVNVMDMAKKAGIDQIEFATDLTEGERRQRVFVGQLREMVEKGEITGEEARERYEKAFPRSKESRRSAED